MLIAVLCIMSLNAQLNLNLKAHYTFGGGAMDDISGNNHNGGLIAGIPMPTPAADRCGNPGQYAC